MTDAVPPAKRVRATETSSVKIPSPEYSEIINLVVATLGDNISFPGDLLVEILSKLPVKSLLRFKAVCKPWKLLITSPVFINIHLHRKNPQLGECSLNQFGEDRVITPFSTSRPRVIGNCNGLICLITSTHDSLVFYNPSTRESSFLPTEYRGDFGTEHGKSFGFFYLPETQEYKLFSFTRITYCALDMKILTLGMNTNSFRHAKDISLPGRSNINHDKHASFGTNMFWLGFDDYMICYDVIEDRFSKMNGPPSSSTSWLITRSLGVLDNSLSVLLYSNDVIASFEIWMLITGDVSMDKSWMKYRTVVPSFGLFSFVTYPVFSSWSDGIIICHYLNDETALSKHQLVTYKESLVSVKSLCSIDVD